MTRLKPYDPTLDPDSPFFGQTDEQLAAYWAKESAYENARLATIKAERDRAALEAKTVRWFSFDGVWDRIHARDEMSFQETYGQEPVWPCSD